MIMSGVMIPLGIALLALGATALVSGLVTDDGGNIKSSVKSFMTATKKIIMNVGTGTYFNLEQTGGSKDAVVVSHTHTQVEHTHTYPSNESNKPYKPWGTKSGSTESGAAISGSGKYYAATANNDYKWLTNMSSEQPTINASGVDGTDKNLPPYLAVNMWKRTA